MKTTFHEICPVCHRESYLEKIDLKYIEAFKAFDEYAYTYILTPITLVYEDPQGQEEKFQKLQTLQKELQSSGLFKQIVQEQPNKLFGWDFFIVGMEREQQGHHNEAKGHFEIFAKILQLTEPNLRISLEKTNYPRLIKQILLYFQQFYENYKFQPPTDLEVYLIGLYGAIIRRLDKVALAKGDLTSQFQDLKFQKAKLKLANLLLYQEGFSLRSFVEEHFKSNQNQDKVTEMIIDLFPKTLPLWKKLIAEELHHGPKMTAYISQIIRSFKGGAFSFGLLIQIASHMKKIKQYWLAYVLYSFARSFLIENKNSTNSVYIPYIYSQLAKLQLYANNGLPLDKFALPQYRKAVETFNDMVQNTNLRPYHPYETNKIFITKLIVRTIVLFFYARSDYSEQIRFFLTQLGKYDLPYHLKEFREFINCRIPTPDKLQKFQGQLIARQVDFFLHYTITCLLKQKNKIIIPTRELIELAKAEELKTLKLEKLQRETNDMSDLLNVIGPVQISQCDLKRKNQPLQLKAQSNQNILFNALVIKLIIVSDTNPILDYKSFVVQNMIIERFLQHMACGVYPVLRHLLTNFKACNDFKYNETLLLASLLLYMSDHIEAKSQLDRFKKTLEFWMERPKQNADLKPYKETIKEFETKIQTLEILSRKIRENFHSKCRTESQVSRKGTFYSERQSQLHQSRTHSIVIQRSPSQQSHYSYLTESHSLFEDQIEPGGYHPGPKHSISSQSQGSNQIYESSLIQDDRSSQQQVSSSTLEISLDISKIYFSNSNLSDVGARGKQSLIQKRRESQFRKSLHERTDFKLFYSVLQDEYIRHQWKIIDENQSYVTAIDSSEFECQSVTWIANSQYTEIKKVMIDNQELIMKVLEIDFLEWDERVTSRVKQILNEVIILLILRKINESQEDFQFLQLTHFQFRSNTLKNQRTSLIFYLVFPYCGTQLEPDKLEEQQKFLLVEKLFQQVNVLHQYQICHLDLKPSNILMLDREGTPVIIDYGSAFSFEYSPRDWVPPQTKGYCAPEIDKESRFSPQSDVYSLGCITYELFTQSRIDSSTATLNMDQIVNYPNKYLVELVTNCTQENPRDRPTCQEALERYIQQT